MILPPWDEVMTQNGGGARRRLGNREAEIRERG